MERGYTAHLVEQDCKLVPSDQASLYYATQTYLLFPQIMLASSNNAYLESNFYWQPELNYVLGVLHA